MRRFLHVPKGVSLLLLVLLTGGCEADTSRGDPGLAVSLRVEPSPPQVGANRVSVTVTDVAWRPRNEAHVEVSAVPEEGGDTLEVWARGIGAGIYVAEEMELPAPGAWVLVARAEMPDGRWREVESRMEVGATGP